ncbi:GlxA family transcriptional regulator [Flexivirga caeni]|uniref:Helix-turn-helix domain-containing protein n=1 Tax=Flexivirga caeni TaxID=2294115 RepID=A0A3M9MFY4_9MICO|nr:helix-turn-helix domain-containing protein [Flexivirga caeni]RNI24469.1 helix-turn-helix domain-containing protein [Flexivirga caeni]
MDNEPAASVPARRHQVAVLALAGAYPMEVGMPFHILGRPGLPYDVQLCATAAGPVDTADGWQMVVPHGLDAVARADTVIIPAFKHHLDGAPDDAAAALRRAHRRGARIVSICTGAFALASAGLLDGRRATTHWREAGDLQRRYPAVTVDADVLFVDEDSIVTSAGVASGIDVCLHLLRADHGAALANSVARQIVAAPRREGGQAQFIERDAPPSRQQGLGPTLEWALAHLDRPLTVADLATHAHLSPRTFARSFTAETGTTPVRWLNAARVDRARELLETTGAGIDHIADLCGLGTPANLRQHFHRITGTTPSEYRRTFATAERD